MAYAELAAPERVPPAAVEIPAPESSQGDAPTLAAERIVRRARYVPALILVALLVVALGVPMTGVDLTEVPAIVGHLFWHQEVYLLPFVVAATLLPPVRVIAPLAPVFLVRDRFAVVLAASLLLLLVCWAGHYLVFAGYNLSRDEAMAHFDTYIFAHGRLVWPFPAIWRPYADALNQTFILPIGQHDAWVSAYLPVNAAIRAAVGHIVDVWLTGPLFVAIGALSLWGIAKRLWPDSPSSRIVALVLYVGSAQILLAGMTAYAMSGHIGLNMLWLWLFLRGGKAGHAGAILVGFLATGLHQPLFHPLFVAPFLLEVLRGERRWRLLAVYLAAYAAIGLFWLAWPGWMAHGFGKTSEAQDVDYVTRLIHTVGWFDVKAAWVMALNLLRFAAWQHLLLLPLLALGIIVTRRDAMARALTIGLLLPVVAMALLLPVQGHGWGYRYVHGVLGSACLLAAYGWHWLEAHGLSYRRAFVWTSVATFAVGIPVHAFMAQRMAQPYASAAAEVAATPADIVIIDNRAALWAADLVINRPDLSNRPIRLAGSQLRPHDMGPLCRGRTIAFFDGPRLHAIQGLFPEVPAHDSALQRDLETAARQAGCVVIGP